MCTSIRNLSYCLPSYCNRTRSSLRLNKLIITKESCFFIIVCNFLCSFKGKYKAELDFSKEVRLLGMGGVGQLPKLGRWDLIDMKNLNQLLELPWLGFAGCQRIFSLVQICIHI